MILKFQKQSGTRRDKKNLSGIQIKTHVQEKQFLRK